MMIGILLLLVVALTTAFRPPLEPPRRGTLQRERVYRLEAALPYFGLR